MDWQDIIFFALLVVWLLASKWIDARTEIRAAESRRRRT